MVQLRGAYDRIPRLSRGEADQSSNIENEHISKGVHSISRFMLFRQHGYICNLQFTNSIRR